VNDGVMLDPNSIILKTPWIRKPTAMPMAKSRRLNLTAILFAVLICFLGATSAVPAMELLSPDSKSLAYSSTLEFDRRADEVFISRDGLTGYIIENEPKGGTAMLSVVSISPFAIKSQITIGHLVSAVALDPKNNGRLFVAGKAGINNAGTVVLTETNEALSYVTLGRDGEIVLAPDHQGGVYAAESASNVVLHIKPEDFLPFQDAMLAYEARKEESDVIRVPDVGGVNALGVSRDDSILFVSDSKRPQIAALNLKMKGIEVSRIGSPLAKEGELPPLHFALAFRESKRAVSGLVSSLYVVDTRQRRLQLLDYNEIVSTFDGISDASLGPPGSISQAQQAVVSIAADDAQEIILLGEGRQASLNLFSRSGSTLQQLVAVGLPQPPRKISLSGNGERALVLLRNGKVALLDTDTTESAPQPVRNTPIGDELTRAIQYRLDRLGFSVGAIDGMAGARTEAATRDAISKLGLDPNLSLKDPEKLLRALETTKSAY
jgi:hypothetical protein